MLSVATLAMIVASCSKDADIVEDNAITETEITETDNQSKSRRCYSAEVYEKQISQRPEILKNLELIEANAKQYLKNSNQKAASVVTIPVYVHVLYRTNRENISLSQINSQIDVLNEDFRRTNSDANRVPSQFANLAADTQVQFRLVDVDRRRTSRRSWDPNRERMKFASQGGINAVDPTNYLNIWICNIQGGTLGYAYLPGTAPTQGHDGVVIGPQYFGTTGSVSAPFNLGRTATHEVGHYLNLRHIWGNGGCNVDDRVADTPVSSTANYGCPSFPTTHCGTTDMTMNYMDYVDDRCMYMFTEGQKSRMRAVLASNGFRAELVR